MSVSEKKQSQQELACSRMESSTWLLLSELEKDRIHFLESEGSSSPENSDELLLNASNPLLQLSDQEKIERFHSRDKEFRQNMVITFQASVIAYPFRLLSVGWSKWQKKE
jgi:hypothetical protein